MCQHSSSLRIPTIRHSVRSIAFVALAVAIFEAQPEAVAQQSVRSVLDDLIRGTARVADDVPVKKVDELVEDLAKSRAARETVDAELRTAGRLGGGGQVLHGAARSDEVLRLLRLAASDVDPTVIRRLGQLDEASLDAAVVLAKGGDELRRAVPDLAMRGQLLRDGGSQTVAAVGMYGPDAARAALRLDEALKGGTLIVKDGTRAVTLSDFGSAMTRYGNASWEFWGKYIQPHWKIWAASGALAAYLANPEYFQDAAGRLTEAGFQHLTEFAGEVAAAAIRGVGEGSGNAAKDVADAARDTFFNAENAVYSVVGTVVFLLALALLFRRVRVWALRPFRWLNRAPTDSHTPRT